MRTLAAALPRRDAALAVTAPAPFDDVESTLRASRPRLHRILFDNIAPFWLPRVLDEAGGGYRLHHGADGEWLGPAPKQVISQARMLWYCARMAQGPDAAAHYLPAARHGYTFLWDTMWDHRDGGFFWEVSAEGRPLRPNKHVLALAYGILACTEYAVASGEPEAAARADTIFEVLERHAHDAQCGGYREFFLPDWSAVIERGTPYFLGAIAPKQFSTHLHLLEALSAYCAYRPVPLVRERLEELVRLLSTVTVEPRAAAGTEWYTRDWTRIGGRRGRRVSYGHDLERIWMLVEACDVLGLPHETQLDRYRSIYASAYRYGYDRRHGGFYEWGRLGQPAFSRDKVWWVQAESLVASLTMYRLTGEPGYARCYLDTLRWIEEHQLDRAVGDWHEVVEEGGRTAGDKAGPWRDPHHQARSMLHCLALLPDEHPTTQAASPSG